jgi:hypothetical protein
MRADEKESAAPAIWGGIYVDANSSVMRLPDRPQSSMISPDGGAAAMEHFFEIGGRHEI